MMKFSFDQIMFVFFFIRILKRSNGDVCNEPLPEGIVSINETEKTGFVLYQLPGDTGMPVTWTYGFQTWGKVQYFSFFLSVFTIEKSKAGSHFKLMKMVDLEETEAKEAPLTVLEGRNDSMEALILHLLFTCHAGKEKVTFHREVQIIAVNEYPPVFISSNTSLTLEEDTVPNQTADFDLWKLITDEDVSSIPPWKRFNIGLNKYTGKENSGEEVFYVTDEGKLKARNGLDYETDKHSYALNVSVEDLQPYETFTIWQIVTVTIENLNDNCPYFAVKVYHHAPVDSSFLGQIQFSPTNIEAKDADGQTNMKYFLITYQDFSEDAAKFIHLNEVNGDIFMTYSLRKPNITVLIFSVGVVEATGIGDDKGLAENPRCQEPSTASRTTVVIFFKKHIEGQPSHANSEKDSLDAKSATILMVVFATLCLILLFALMFFILVSKTQTEEVPVIKKGPEKEKSPEQKAPVDRVETEKQPSRKPEAFFERVGRGETYLE